jgi:D-alanyl-D-alanine carboxypeptidase
VVGSLVGALATLAAFAVREGTFSPDESAPSTAPSTAPSSRQVDEVSAPVEASAPVAAPSVSVRFEIDDPSAVTVVVTKLRPLDPIDYVPADLVVLSGVPGGRGQQLRSVAADAMTHMYESALAAGAPFRVTSAYRSYGCQESLYWGYASASGSTAADRFSARPGHSEHQTGLAVDVYDTGANRLRASFGASVVGTWLAANAYEYGFIVSYPEDKEDVTGYRWEPWHLRYVGVGVSTAMHDLGVVTLQEFMGVEASPDYE